MACFFASIRAWHQTTNQALFQLQPSEVQEILNGFKNPDDVRSSGVHVNGVKYLTLRADERSIYGKKVIFNVCSQRKTHSW